MQIRAFDEDETDGVRQLLDAAFDGVAESRIVRALRAADADTLELIAEDHGRIVGEIMFSPVTGRTASGTELYGIGLGPVAVAPDVQKRGIGSALIEHGLEYLKKLGVPFCVLLGDPAYYKRFGFTPARNINWFWEADPEAKYGDAFQLLSLSGAPIDVTGVTISYHAAFAAGED